MSWVRSRKEKNKGNEWLWKRKSWIKKVKVVQEVKGGESERESAGPWGDICVCSSIRDQLSEVTWAGKTRTPASTASLSHFSLPIFLFFLFRLSFRLSASFCDVCARQSFNQVSFTSICHSPCHFANSSLFRDTKSLKAVPVDGHLSDRPIALKAHALPAVVSSGTARPVHGAESVVVYPSVGNRP